MTTPEQSLLDTLGLEELLPEEQQQVLADVGSLIFEGTLVRLLEQMDEPTRAKFDALLTTNAAEDEVMDFLKANVPGAEAAVTQTIEELRDDILAVSGPVPA
jgi:hypothetical protein